MSNMAAQHFQHANFCPYCGGDEFDGLGFVHVDGTEMYQQQCQACKLLFANEVKTGIQGDDR